MYEIFEQLMALNGVTAYKVAKETGVPQPTLSDWKRGKSVPKIDKLQKIANYFGVTVDYLMGIEKVLMDRDQIMLTDLSPEIVKFAKEIQNLELSNNELKSILLMAKTLKNK